MTKRVLVRQVVGQVSDLPVLKFLRRAGPRPLLHLLSQPSAHGISFDVPYYPLKFPVVSNPMVIGFILPKWLAGVAKNDIGLPGARTFYSPGYLSQRLVRLQENVHVVGHHHPGEKVAQHPLPMGYEQCIDHSSGDTWVCQPHRTRKPMVQFPIDQCKPLAFGRGVGRAQIAAARQGAVKPPSQKDWNTFRLPMRQSTTIETDDKTVVIRMDSSYSGRSETCPTAGPTL
jgi:hypothetical protein